MKNLSQITENEHISTKKYVDDGLAEKSDIGHTHTIVNGHSVNSDVPSNAIFTDTVTIVDSTLSSTSTNPVQNNTIYNALSGKSDTSHTHSQYLQKSGGTMTGILYAYRNASYTTAQVRNCSMSTSSASGGGNGDIHFTYTA